MALAHMIISSNMDENTHNENNVQGNSSGIISESLALDLHLPRYESSLMVGAQIPSTLRLA